MTTSATSALRSVGPNPIAIVVNGPSSSGKSTLCRALQDRLTDIADGDPDAAFARVAFDDVVFLMSDKLHPISFVSLKGGDLSQLASRVPHDGRASWEYIDESQAEGKHGGSPRLRLVLNAYGRRLLCGVHNSWAAHLKLGTNMIIDHFIQEGAWCEELLGVLRDAGARIFFVGVFCSMAELERRESSRGDGGVEGRPLGLARRSDELCHAHNLDYSVILRTDQQTTAESVDLILQSLRKAGLVAPLEITGTQRDS
jgi:chloramphenicol 3-O phosphotransferase